METLSQYTIAPQHAPDLAELDPYVIENVAYSPLKMSFLSPSYAEDIGVYCDSCNWSTTVGELPQDTGYVQPDMCPECAKSGEIGHIRSESPADRTLPKGWDKNE